MAKMPAMNAKTGINISVSCGDDGETSAILLEVYATVLNGNNIDFEPLGFAAYRRLTENIAYESHFSLRFSTLF